LSSANWWRTSNYINDEAAENLRNYRYVGGDNGFSYPHCYSPLADWFVTLFPEWMAPNVITLIGFSFAMIVSIAGFAFWGTTFDDADAP
jgi:hypothetical protein